MATHRFHPDVADPYNDSTDAILYDGCDRCDQLSIRIYDLDYSHIQRLWNRMIAVEVDETESYRSINENVACDRLWLFYLLVERFGNIKPRDLFADQG